MKKFKLIALLALVGLFVGCAGNGKTVDTECQKEQMQVAVNKDSWGVCCDKEVDLGLTVNWAGWNVGATQVPRSYGGLYSLGDIPMSGWEDGWRLPTEAEIDELRTLCKWSWMEYTNGVRGMKVVGPNGNAIFLPAAGLRDEDNTIVNRALYGGYWSSDRSDSATGGNYLLEFDDFDGRTDETGEPLIVWGYYRYLDKSVRLVSDK